MRGWPERWRTVWLYLDSMCPRMMRIAVILARLFEHEDGIVAFVRSYRIADFVFACRFGALDSLTEAFGERGKMDKCTFCAGGPDRAWFC